MESNTERTMTQVWISAAGLALATIIGSLLGFIIKALPHKWNDAVLGYCAGIMLAASTIGLIVPAAESAGLGKWWLILTGVALGVMFLNVLDLVTPHLHKITGMDAEEHRNNASLNHVLLFVMAIALHKLPEGIAAGVGFNAAESTDAWAVTLGIALQNIPEGMVVIAPLLVAGVSKLRTFIISLAIALLEIVGVWIGYGIGAISAILRGAKEVDSIYLTKEDLAKVAIPCSPDLIKILEKYNYDIPHLSDQNINDNIKEIARLAGLNEKVTEKYDYFD